MKRFAHLGLFSIMVLTFALTSTTAHAKCQQSTPAMRHMENVRITLQNDQKKRIRFYALIADEPAESAAGYQHICPQVIARTAMLFHFPAPIFTQFHMRNVKAPLDIGFFDEKGILIQSMIMYPYKDDKEILYAPMQKFQYALEAKRGFFQEKELSAGTTRLILKSLP